MQCTQILSSHDIFAKTTSLISFHLFPWVIQTSPRCLHGSTIQVIMIFSLFHWSYTRPVFRFILHMSYHGGSVIMKYCIFARMTQMNFVRLGKSAAVLWNVLIQYSIIKSTANTRFSLLLQYTRSGLCAYVCPFSYHHEKTILCSLLCGVLWIV